VKEQSTPDSLDLEVGRRLGQLRIRAGLTQAQLAARLTGVNKGWQQAVSRAELGKAGHISFPFTIDYMRACGASFADIEDILDRYLSRPPRIEERAWQAVQAAAANLPDRMKTRALYYDIGLHSKAGQQARKASDVDERVRRAVNRGKTEAMCSSFRTSLKVWCSLCSIASVLPRFTARRTRSSTSDAFRACCPALLCRPMS
jgi:transcriptional regulator with XRE-family HTH domain